MGGAGLPADVRRFIDQHLDSALELEILLLLHRAGRVMTAREVATELRSDRDHVAATLADLTTDRLVVSTGEGAALRPGRKNRDVVAALARAYETHRVAVVQAIFSKPSEAVRGFADAFRLRDEEPDDE